MKKIHKKYLLTSGLILGTLFISIPTVILVSNKLKSNIKVNLLPINIEKDLETTQYDDLVRTKIINYEGDVFIYDKKQVLDQQSLFDFQKIIKYLNNKDYEIVNKIENLLNTTELEYYLLDSSLVSSMSTLYDLGKFNTSEIEKKLDQYWNASEGYFANENNINNYILVNGQIYNFFIENNLEYFYKRYDISSYIQKILNNFDINNTSFWMAITAIYIAASDISSYSFDKEKIRTWIDMNLNNNITWLRYWTRILPAFYPEKMDQLKSWYSNKSTDEIIEFDPNLFSYYLELMNENISDDLIISHINYWKKSLYTYYTHDAKNTFFSLSISPNSDQFYKSVNKYIKQSVIKLIRSDETWSSDDFIQIYYYSKILFKYDNNYLNTLWKEIMNKVNEKLKLNNNFTSYLYALKILNIFGNFDDEIYLKRNINDLIEWNLNSFLKLDREMTFDFLINTLLMAKFIDHNQYKKLENLIIENKNKLVLHPIKTWQFLDLLDSIKLLGIENELSDPIINYFNLLKSSIKNTPDNSIDIYLVNLKI
ncbi:hypothetical protein HUN03_00702 [Mycoplasmopsis anatis]|uniref:Uncharacterized protein n=1 Tax=Mycoplasmopsis anatis TaxID=171279 RepID=A0A9Q3L5Q8_9BACT|nr:hypothetical protein [Mycoplasmopsis anatis]MBW0594317.1 hypothetical protein [Mycoplasmopsis anatis]MBW0595140.1 hypothetical protein [Mycoplasmopsis anatis]MBW0596031.1 hypothetical protein [Mycoplasmopsis anatis]MBW0596550.1 hypothetical protein [Mycoplasmopsis anatis]MBW0597451.1 hypothetical protein [Mycoplasmopsis anatis]